MHSTNLQSKKKHDDDNNFDWWFEDVPNRRPYYRDQLKGGGLSPELPSYDPQPAVNLY